jgi:hypothetical protein
MFYDPTAISAALGSIRAIFDLLKNANDAQLAMRISAEVANVQGQLIDVQQLTLRIQQDNQELHEQISKFRTYIHHHSVIWRIKPDGTEDGPFCPPCHAEGLDMRLALTPTADLKYEQLQLWCPKTHVDPRAVPSAWQPQRQDPTYWIPRTLVPENYF